MSLSAALSAARSSLATHSGQTSLISRNIGGADQPLHARKSANLVTTLGGVRIESVARAASAPLFTTMLDTGARSAGHAALADGIGRLAATIGDPELAQSPAARLSALGDALQRYAASPDDQVAGRAAIAAAADMAGTLRAASGTVQEVRQQAHTDMEISVARINDLLARFEAVNTAIVRGTRAGGDVSDPLDQRDRLTADLSLEIGIRVVRRADNDVALYTDGGVTLFETRPRAVSIGNTGPLQPGAEGPAVHVDGVAVTGDSATMALGSGRLHGLAALRDDVAVTYQAQLDEMARGLIETFADSDTRTPASLPTIPGLFTHPGAPSMPPAGTVAPGLAAGIAVAAAADPSRGGSVERLRDGGIGNPAQPGYRANPGGASAFSARLESLRDGIMQPRAFDPAAGAGARADLAAYAAASVGWLEAARQAAGDESETLGVLAQRSAEALSNATGVNIDHEMTSLLEIERSYQAAARLVSTIDRMLAELMAVVR